MQITPFAVEMWMNAHETRCTLNLAETCVESLTVAQLLDLAGANAGDLSALLPMKLTYGDIPGSDRLRDAIAAHYDRQTRDNVVVTHGTIGANALVHQALVGRGDRVVAAVPTYQQHYSIPAALGAEVVPLPLRPENRWLPDMDELRALATPGTRLIALTNPNNPTGALIDRAGLEQVAQIARDAGAWVLCDEVYRGTDQDAPGITASMADIYEKGISTAGMSKAFSLAGLRLGWVVAPPEVVEAVMIHRDYTTISVGMIDDHLSALALGARDRVLGRARAITRTNLAILADWVAGEPRASWVRPRSGTTALVRLDLPMGCADFCKALLAGTGVLFTPGAAFDLPGHVRIGYACATDVLREGLARTSGFLARLD